MRELTFKLRQQEASIRQILLYKDGKLQADVVVRAFDGYEFQMLVEDINVKIEIDAIPGELSIEKLEMCIVDLETELSNLKDAG